MWGSQPLGFATSSTASATSETSSGGTRKPGGVDRHTGQPDLLAGPRGLRRLPGPDRTARGRGARPVVRGGASLQRRRRRGRCGHRGSARRRPDRPTAPPAPGSLGSRPDQGAGDVFGAAGTSVATSPWRGGSSASDPASRRHLPAAGSEPGRLQAEAEIVGWVDGMAVPKTLVGRCLASLRDGPLAALLPRDGTAEGRQLVRWAAQVVLVETLCRAEAARRGGPVTDGGPVRLDRRAAAELGRAGPGRAGPIHSDINFSSETDKKLTGEFAQPQCAQPRVRVEYSPRHALVSGRGVNSPGSPAPWPFERSPPPDSSTPATPPPARQPPPALKRSPEEPRLRAWHGVEAARGPGIFAQRISYLLASPHQFA